MAYIEFYDFCVLRNNRWLEKVTNCVRVCYLEGERGVQNHEKLRNLIYVWLFILIFYNFAYMTVQNWVL